jgi:hypothetical protein
VTITGAWRTNFVIERAFRAIGIILLHRLLGRLHLGEQAHLRARDQLRPHRRLKRTTVVR